MGGNSGGGGKPGRGGPGGGGDATEQIAQLTTEIEKLKSARKYIDEQLQKIGYSVADQKLRKSLNDARDAAGRKISELDYKRYNLKPITISPKKAKEIAESREKSEANFQAKFWKEKANAPSKTVKRLKKEGLYDDPGATNSWKDYS
jgi:hypothetical protein